MDIIGPLQLRVMHVIWDKGASTVREVHSHLNEGLPEDKQLAYTTILTVMRNLARRKLLSQQAVGRSHVFEPTVDADTYRQSVLRALCRDYFTGDVASLSQYIATHQEDIVNADLELVSAR